MLDTGNRSRALRQRLVERRREIYVWCIARCDPKIGVEFFDSDGRVAEQPEKQSDLHEYQSYGECHAGKRNEKPQLVVEKIFESEVDHYEVSVTYTSFDVELVSFDVLTTPRYNTGMKILALDTSGDRASVALWRDGEISKRAISAVHQHSRFVPAMIDEILREAELSLAVLDGIAFGSGPGAFTGLRIACGVAQGLAFGAGLQVIAVPTLLAMAAASGRERVLTAIDARMGEIYFAAYVRGDRNWQCQLDPTLCRPESAPVLPGQWAGAGNGFDAGSGALKNRYAGQLDYVDAALCAQAQQIAAVAAATPRSEWLDPADAAPLYIRNKVALTIAER